MLEIFFYGTRECNLACAYCSNKQDFYKDEYPARIKKLIQVLDDNPGMAVKLFVSGGEPFVDRRLMDDVYEIAKSHDNIRELKFFTNGLCVTWDAVERFAKLGIMCSLLIGVDGLEKTFQKLLEVNPGIKDLLCVSTINYVIGGEDAICKLADDLNELLKYTDKIKVNYDKFKMQDLPHIWERIQDQIKQTTYIPPKREEPLFNFACTRTVIHFDGCIQPCEWYLTADQLHMADVFQAYTCKDCTLNLYCEGSCRPLLIGSSFNRCLLTEALCSNLKETEL